MKRKRYPPILHYLIFFTEGGWQDTHSKFKSTKNNYHIWLSIVFKMHTAASKGRQDISKKFIYRMGGLQVSKMYWKV